MKILNEKQEPIENSYASEMRLYDPVTQERLYLDDDERELFLHHADELDNHKHRLFCRTLHWTGLRLTELRNLTGAGVDFRRRSIIVRTLKKRKYTKKGQLKAPQHREIPLDINELMGLDLVFNLRQRKKKKDKTLALPLWAQEDDATQPIDRSTGWRIVKRVLTAAGIDGAQATAKGLRHGYGVAMILGGMNIQELARRMGHESTNTTAIYLQAVGKEAYAMQAQAWAKANSGWDNG